MTSSRLGAWLPVFVLLASTAVAQSRYTATSIGALPDADPTIPTPPTSTTTGINDLGAVTGTSWISGGCIQLAPNVTQCEPVIVHAVLWQSGVLAALEAPIPGLQPTQFTTVPRAIADRYQIVGEMQTSRDPYAHAFSWQPSITVDNGFVELPSLIPGDARAWAVNDAGVVVGESDAAGTLGFHAVVWRASDRGWTVRDLGTFGGASSRALGINELDQITGWSFAGNRQTTFLDLPQPAYGLPAGMNDVTPGLSTTKGNDVNDAGAIVGGAGGLPLPMIWLPAAAYGLPAGATVFPASAVATPATLAALGALALDHAEFTAINDAGVATVEAWFVFPGPRGTYTESRGMVWVNGAFVALDELLVAGSGWQTITGATGVNQRGEIAASGITAAGDYLGAVLSPVDTRR